MEWTVKHLRTTPSWMSYWIDKQVHWYSIAPLERTRFSGITAYNACHLLSLERFCSYFYIGNKAASEKDINLPSPLACALMKLNCSYFHTFFLSSDSTVTSDFVSFDSFSIHSRTLARSWLCSPPKNIVEAKWVMTILGQNWISRKKTEWELERSGKGEEEEEHE